MNNIKKNFMYLVPVLLLLMISGTLTITEAFGQQEQILAITNARIYPVTSPVIPSGVLVVQGGKILAVGADVSIPPGAEVIDARGKYVMPGIVETHSHMGLKLLWEPHTGRDNNELSKPDNAEVRAIDGINTNDRAFSIALAGGVTTMCCITGSQSPNSGQAVVIKLRGGTAEEMFLVHGGMKFAIRRGGRSGRPDFPGSVEEIGEFFKNQLRAAQKYLEEWERYESGDRKGTPPARDLKLEALGKVLTREWIVGVHSSREDELRIVMDLKKEFNVDIYIIHGRGASDVGEELVELEIPVSYGPVLPGAGRESASLEGAVRFNNIGGKLSFHQDHPDGHQYYLRPCASLFVRKGMSKEDALRALTINPAELLHVDDRVGSLEPGKDADFLILTGPPLEIESLVEHVFIDGKEVYNRNTGFVVFQFR